MSRNNSTGMNLLSDKHTISYVWQYLLICLIANRACLWSFPYSSIRFFLTNNADLYILWDNLPCVKIAPILAFNIIYNFWTTEHCLTDLISLSRKYSWMRRFTSLYIRCTEPWPSNSILYWYERVWYPLVFLIVDIVWLIWIRLVFEWKLKWTQ